MHLLEPAPTHTSLTGHDGATRDVFSLLVQSAMTLEVRTDTDEIIMAADLCPTPDGSWQLRDPAGDPCLHASPPCSPSDSDIAAESIELSLVGNVAARPLVLTLSAPSPASAATAAAAAAAATYPLAPTSRIRARTPRISLSAIAESTTAEVRATRRPSDSRQLSRGFHCERCRCV
jgi:hypothetical protein